MSDFHLLLVYLEAEWRRTDTGAPEPIGGIIQYVTTYDWSDAPFKAYDTAKEPTTNRSEATLYKPYTHALTVAAARKATLIATQSYQRHPTEVRVIPVYA